MSAQPFGNGWNPRYGVDQSPNARPAVNTALPAGVPPPPGYPMNRGPFTFPGPISQGPTYVVPQNGFNHPVPTFPGQPARFPTAHPVVSADTPALNFSNSTGGFNCEPGYNYFFFHDEHTKIHVIKSATAPWRLPSSSSFDFNAYQVPVKVTLADLMTGFGAQNADPRKNRITEVVQGGNGKWYKGTTFTGDDADMMGKSLKSLGWDRTRTGRPREKPVTWLWSQKTKNKMRAN